jgi:hypothetical protein
VNSNIFTYNSSPPIFDFKFELLIDHTIFQIVSHFSSSTFIAFAMDL